MIHTRVGEGAMLDWVGFRPSGSATYSTHTCAPLSCYTWGLACGRRGVHARVWRMDPSMLRRSARKAAIGCATCSSTLQQSSAHVHVLPKGIVRQRQCSLLTRSTVTVFEVT